MIVEFGHFALFLALAVAIAQSVLPIVGFFRRDPALMAVAPKISQMAYWPILPLSQSMARENLSRACIGVSVCGGRAGGWRGLQASASRVGQPRANSGRL